MVTTIVGRDTDDETPCRHTMVNQSGRLDVGGPVDIIFNHPKINLSLPLRLLGHVPSILRPRIPVHHVLRLSLDLQVLRCGLDVQGSSVRT